MAEAMVIRFGDMFQLSSTLVEVFHWSTTSWLFIWLAESRALTLTVPKEQSGEEASFRGPFREDVVAFLCEYDGAICAFPWRVVVAPVNFLCGFDESVFLDEVFHCVLKKGALTSFHFLQGLWI